MLFRGKRQSRHRALRSIRVVEDLWALLTAAGIDEPHAQRHVDDEDTSGNAPYYAEE